MRELSLEEKMLIVEDAEAWNLNRKLSEHELVSFSNGPAEFCDILMDKTFKDIDLSNIRFNDLSFFNTIFGENVNLTNTTFTWCTFKYGLFEKANIKNTMFNKCKMNSIWESTFKSCFFTGCVFPEDIQDSYFEAISLIDCFMRGIGFSSSDIFCSTITNSNLDRLSIKGSKVRNCTMKHVSALRVEMKTSVFENNFLDNVQTDDYFTPLFCHSKDNNTV